MVEEADNVDEGVGEGVIVPVGVGVGVTDAESDPERVLLEVREIVGVSLEVPVRIFFSEFEGERVASMVCVGVGGGMKELGELVGVGDDEVECEAKGKSDIEIGVDVTVLIKVESGVKLLSGR